MKRHGAGYVRVHRTGNLTDVVGPVNRVRFLPGGLEMTAPNGLYTFIPWTVVTRFTFDAKAQPL